MSDVFWRERFWGERVEKLKKGGTYWFWWGVVLAQLYKMQRWILTVIGLGTGGYSLGIYKDRSDIYVISWRCRSRERGLTEEVFISD